MGSLLLWALLFFDGLFAYNKEVLIAFYGRKIEEITAFKPRKVGFIFSSGFETKKDGIICISGDEMYNLTDWV